jgi:hypothetical protein
MSEIMEHIRGLIAESDHLVSGECPVEKRRRELDAERERKVREAHEAEEKRQVASTNWYAAVDGRIHEHLANWLWAAIDERMQQWWKREWDVLKDAIGGAMGTIRQQVRDEFKRAIEEQQRSFEVKLAEQKERLLALNNAADGARERAHLREEVKRALEETADAFGTEIAALERRLKAVPGKLPVAKTWHAESVIYQAEFVCHDGSLWQARKDTAQAPGGPDWICVARAGHDGCDGLTLNLRGRFEAYKKYQRLDVIEFDGGSFVALHDDPGIPGDPGWQLLCHRGNRGPAGDVGPRGRKGERGARGEAMPTIVSWTIDRTHYRAVPTMSNGQAGAPLELRGLFEQFVLESSYIASTGS